ncbi:MAG: putative toxin-antitoxin system toxin component, PIN family [Anaerovoracaceae bacterium]
MRVMLDTNVIISALLFPSPIMDSIISNVTSKNNLVLSKNITEEFLRVSREKFPSKYLAVKKLLSELVFEEYEIPLDAVMPNVDIRDETDYPIIAAAILSDVDVFVTGDKDFEDLDLERPEILKPLEYIRKYL